MINIGITIGDPSGIGPEIALRAVKALKEKAGFLIIGDFSVLKRLSFFKGIKGERVEIVDVRAVDARRFSFGKISPEYGQASIKYLDKALSLLDEKKISALVTCPISKEAINRAGFRYSGHTEHFAQKTKTDYPVMMLLNGSLRFSLVTRHISIKRLPGSLTRQNILHTLLATKHSLLNDFKVRSPRIILCALNPHASDGGLIGREEVNVIGPAACLAKKRGCLVDGPVPADIAVYKALKGEYDAVVAMNHDQALIPLKITGFETGVNMTLGLPFVRTSPLHGTAFDIARTPGLADPSSLIAAIKLAVRCASARKRA